MPSRALAGEVVARDPPQEEDDFREQMHGLLPKHGQQHSLAKGRSLAGHRGPQKP